MGNHLPCILLHEQFASSVCSVAVAGISLWLLSYFLMPASFDCLFYWPKCLLGVKMKVLLHSVCMQQVDVDHFLATNYQHHEKELKGF